jgi:hypothetical protein
MLSFMEALVEVVLDTRVVQVVEVVIVVVVVQDIIIQLVPG